MRTLIRDAEVAGRRVDVLLDGERIATLGEPSTIRPAARDEVIDGAGGVLMPGLHDHHLHVLAIAARSRSVDLGGDKGLAALRDADGTGWIRGTGYDEDALGSLDRYVLDAWVPDRPVRVQHRSGALWVLNSAALRIVGLDGTGGESGDVERVGGEPTGRLWRYDARLRQALPDDNRVTPEEIAAVGRRLASYGITGVTDATPELDAAAAALIDRLPQRVTLMGRTPGAPVKLHLRDHDLPSLDDLKQLISAARERDRPVAVHCVTAESLLLTLNALQEVGARPGDRIEHASVVPPGVGEWMARLGVRVITQPDFLRTRGDGYLRNVDPVDRGHLYPYAGLQAAGVPVCASSDAPYGELDPWRVIKSASTRETIEGDVVTAAERVTVGRALDGYLSPVDRPGGAARTVRGGAPADLVLLHVPLAEVLVDPRCDLVRATWIEGRLVGGMAGRS
ncbi:amidohydrolase family protein [Microbispora sp. H11081]|uniref:amidohydrolase family protein n=1 Tax=Microbispora sp. H11081 TaxID=2729107 RepID=UPI0014761191|nr:amidohydrolase family protein [Microbispora sp. H11081]